MRVLHLTTHLNIGGITSYIERLITPFAQDGIETYVLSSGGEKAPEFIQQGAVLFTLPIRTKNAFHPKVWLAVPKVTRLVRNHKIEILHAHTRVTQVLAAMVSFFTGIPVVTTCHGFFKPKFGRKIFPCWGKKTIAISPLVRDQLQNDFSVPKSQIDLIPNAVDVAALEKKIASKNASECRKYYGFPENARVTGIIARLVDDKGHESLIRAADILRRKVPQFRLLIIGEGRHKEYLENLTAELNLQDHVHFAGNAPDITVPLAAMEIFSLPATWREGFGLSVIEAMACRKPVVVGNIWALNALVEDGRTGLIVEPNQPEALASALLKIMTDSPLRQRVIQQAYEMVQSRYDMPAMVKSLKDLYSQLLLTPQ